MLLFYSKKNNDLEMLHSLCRIFNVKATDLKAIFHTFTPFDSEKMCLFQIIEIEN